MNDKQKDQLLDINGVKELVINVKQLITNHTHKYAGSSTEGGSANSAVKLEVARKIGNASFDGTSDVTLSELGVVNPVYLTKGEYETKKANGTLNSDTYYYVGELGIYKGSQCIVEIGSIPIATTTTLGGIKPDGKLHL